ncbi:enoyl-CoA hydratase [Paeniglutamicibacter sp. MACA_103]|uniref:enoyl-CoA hydratase n=1 Tax=Paeniglutamicibacter sp. MACA_103 TaxID=3377337 RepID=UPI0038936B89
MTVTQETTHTELTLAGEVATVCLRNAKTVNVLGREAIAELTEVFRALGERSDVRVIVFRGSGDKAFIGGANIHEMAELDPEMARSFIRGLMDLGETIRSVPQPVIARMAGWCLGGGLEMAVACDLRVADSGAQMGMPEVAVGIPSVIHSVLIPQLIGRGRASQLLMTAEPISAHKALGWGLVDAVVELDDLDREILRWADKYLAIGGEVLAQQKRLMNGWDELTTSEAMEQSVTAFSEAYKTGQPQRLMSEFANRKRTGSSAT